MVIDHQIGTGTLTLETPITGQTTGDTYYLTKRLVAMIQLYSVRPENDALLLLLNAPRSILVRIELITFLWNHGYQEYAQQNASFRKRCKKHLPL